MVVYDAVVVGLGGVGSFALRNLARQGKGGKFLGIERFNIGHSNGSSHGKSRIYRRAYFEHANYVPWIEYSLKQFRELEVSSGLSLMEECGALVMDTTDDPNKLPPYVQACHDSAQEHGIPVEVLELGDLQERFPQLWYNHKGMMGIYEPHAGILRPERIIKAALDEAKAKDSVEITENGWVAEIQDLSKPGERGPVELVIKTDDGQEQHVVTRNLLVAAGAWTGQLIPEWKPHLSVTRQVQGWIDVSKTEGDSSLFDSANFPAWFMSSPDLPLPAYGIPCDTNGDEEYKHWIKVGVHGRNISVRDLAKNPATCSPIEKAEMQLSTARSLSTAAWRSPQNPMPSYAELKPCLYTMTADTHYMIGKPAGYESVFCVAGLSGHGELLCT